VNQGIRWATAQRIGSNIAQKTCRCELIWFKNPLAGV
jgi:hypothetical protein